MIAAAILILYAAYELAPRSPRRARPSATVVRGAFTALRSVAQAPVSSVLRAPDRPAMDAPDGDAEAPEAPVEARPAAVPDAERTRRETYLLAAISILAGLFYYLPFVLRLPSIGGIPFNGQNMDRVYGMWDGPIFYTEAAALWDPNPHNPLYAWQGQPPSYYTEHFPLYPLAIRLVSPLFGYWNGGLFVNVVVSTLVTLLLYTFLRRFSPVPHLALWVALVSIFWPPRGFFYRYTPMSEPLCILGVLGAAYFFKTKRYTLAGLFGAMAVASRPNSVLMVVAFAILALARLRGVPRGRWLSEVRRMAGLALMPLAFVAIGALYQLRFGDWLAAAHASSFVSPQLNTLFPFLYFFHIGEEGTSYTFFLCLAGILELARRRQWDLAVLSAAFYVPDLFVSTDTSRFLLPILPFVFALAGDRILGSKPVRIALILCIPMIYTYAWSTMLDPGYQAPFGPLRALLP